MVRARKALRVVQFQCGGQNYCFDSTSVVDVVPVSRMQVHDTLPQDAVGAVAVGGTVRPVYSLAQQLGQEKAGAVSGDDDVIIVQSSQRAWGLLVNRVLPKKAQSVAQVVPLPQLLRKSPRNLAEAVVFLGEGEIAGEGTGAHPERSNMILMLSPGLLHAQTDDMLAVVQHSFRPPSGSSLLGADPFGACSGSPTGTQVGHRRASLVVFTIGDECQSVSLALSVTQVVEISRLTSWIPVPAPPRYVLGLLDWRGQPAVVVDLGAKLGLSTSPVKSASRLLVARGFPGNRDLVAFPVGTGARVIQVPAKSHIGRAPEACRTDLLCGSFEVEGQDLLIPDMPKILAGR